MRTITLLDDTILKLHDEGEMLSDHIAREIDYFEREILDYMSDKHPQNEIILDIGANIGNHTAYFAQYLEYGDIIAFEPVPANFNLLRENTFRYPNVYIRREAVGDIRKTVEVQINKTNMGACEVHETGDIKVQQVRIDDLFLIKPVTLMKIDVEYYEPQVLAGAANTIKEDRPLILIEDHSGEVISPLLMSSYTIEKAWPEHKTYLYRSIL